MLPGIRRGILALLTGLEPTQIDAALESMGLSGALTERQGSDVAFKPVGSLRGPVLPVPVFPYDLNGTDTNTFPAVSLVWRGVQGRQSNFILPVPQEDIIEEVSGSSMDLEPAYTAPVTRNSLRYRRPHPISVDVFFDIRVDSRNSVELSLIVERIFELLGGFKSYVSVTLNDRSVVTYDTRMDDPVKLEIPLGVFEAQEYAYNSYIFKYVVEAYTDNTSLKQLKALVKHREYEAAEYDQDTGEIVEDPVT